MAILRFRWQSDGVLLFAPDDAEDEASHKQADALHEDGDPRAHPHLPRGVCVVLRPCSVLPQRGARRVSAPHCCARGAGGCSGCVATPRVDTHAVAGRQPHTTPHPLRAARAWTMIHTPPPSEQNMMTKQTPT